MASSRKKKTNSKSANRKSTGTTRSGSRGGAAKKAPPKKNARPVRREVWAAICLVLALCVLVSYFQADAVFLRYFSTALKGLLGYGYWLCAPALALAGWNLWFHHGRPVRLRTACTLLLPLLLSCTLHVILCRTSYSLSGDLLPLLWQDGQQLRCGGALCGAIAVAFGTVFSKVVAGILFGVLLFAAGFVSLRVNPRQIARKVRERERVPYEEEPLPERRVHQHRPSRREEQTHHRRRGRAAIDIPVDDVKQPEEEKPARRGRRTPETRESAAELFREENPVPLTVPVTPPAPSPAPASPAPTGDVSPLTGQPTKNFFAEKPEEIRTPAEVLDPKQKPEGGRRAAAAEVAAATEEVSRAIESELAEPEETYHYPPITLLNENRADNYTEVGAELRNNSRRLADTLHSFGVDAQAGEVVHGPSVTRYEFTLDQGVKLSKITNLSDDIALALGSSGVRIAPIPNKISAVGIEVPNRAVTPVCIRDVIESRAFVDHPSRVAFSIGKDIGGMQIVGDIAKLPHVLIAGTTGSGKSVCTNSLIVSLLYKSTPDEVRFIMVDPKMVELAPYNGIPHLLIPVVTDPKKAAGALQWAVFEMMKRYKIFSENGVKDLAGFNALVESDEALREQGLKKMPTVVVVIDELADLMLVAAKEVEESICRVAQMGRAAGMHLVIATQRPSADVITGLMKANIPSRIAFAVASSLESRIILDTTGAEKLVGKGDMLYFPLGMQKPLRVQGCFISPEEIERVVAFVKDESGEASYDEDVMNKIEETLKKDEKGGKSAPSDSDAKDDYDELLDSAVEVVLELGQASVSMLQRRLKLGYSRAARLVDQMEELGYVGPFEGSKPRQLLITKAQWQELKMKRSGQDAEPEPEIDRYGSVSDVFESHDALD